MPKTDEAKTLLIERLEDWVRHTERRDHHAEKMEEHRKKEGEERETINTLRSSINELAEESSLEFPCVIETEAAHVLVKKRSEKVYLSQIPVYNTQEDA